MSDDEDVEVNNNEEENENSSDGNEDNENEEDEQNEENEDNDNNNNKDNNNNNDIDNNNNDNNSQIQNDSQQNKEEEQQQSEPQDTPIDILDPYPRSQMINTHYAIHGSLNNSFDAHESPPQTPPIIINDIRVSKPKISLPSHLFRKPKQQYRLTYIFKHTPYTLTLSPTTPISTILSLISSSLRLPLNKFHLYYNNTLLNDHSDSPINTFITYEQTRTSFLEVKRLYKEPTTMLSHSMKAYNYKVIIDNVPSTKMFYDKVDMFCKDNAMIKVDCLILPLSDKTYSVGFLRMDLAFDFDRFMNIVKKSDNAFERIRIRKEVESKGKTLRRVKSEMDYNEVKERERRYKRNYPVSRFLLGAYVNKDDITRQERIDNKKKWINKKTFISCVGYSVNKYKHL